MIDSWFKKDLQVILEQHSVAVFIDESGDAEFLLHSVENDYTVHTANSEIEELHVKYLIERHQPSHAKFLIYTRNKKNDLKFVREYCETNGCLEIRHLQNYIKDKVHQTLNLNINLPKDELISAAKVSVGKDRTYWMDLSHKGAGEIFDLKKELLPFVHDPEKYSKEKYDAQLRETFYRKVNELLGQEYMAKPAATLAEEVVKSMLDGLAYNSCHSILETVYHGWIDSVSFSDSLTQYLSQYTVPTDINLWDVNMNHPFLQVDEKWLAEVGHHIADNSAMPHYLAKIKQRHKSKQAAALGISFWSDVLVLLEFDTKDISYLSSFEECVEFYTKHFSKLDAAIRNLYAEFLNKKQLLEPFQELYKESISIFLDKWFKCFDGYQENQTGTLQRIIDENTEKIAVIVGDGVAYDIAIQIAEKVNSRFKLARNTLIADIPSETANNMSRIYMDNGVTENVQSKREKYLIDQNADKTIDFIRLDEVNEEARSGQYLICTYKDIDDMGEKLQLKALKYFAESIVFFSEKIAQILDSGYTKVYLISDHGFVLTGLLTEADKISVSLEGVSEKSERYIITSERQANLSPDLIEKEGNHNNFKYLYFSRNMNPFKTPGVYGFSHGGASPQELVTPYFCWERSENLISAL
nr:PglZ domain-containing protein [Candidatus Brocadiales bacterium]